MFCCCEHLLSALTQHVAVTLLGHGLSVEQLSTRTFAKSACANNDVCEASWSNTFRVLSLQTMCAEPVAAWCTADLYFVSSKSVRQLLIWCVLSQVWRCKLCF